MMRFASLGSGSKGNATLVQAMDTLVMVDCGFSLRETLRRLSLLGVEPQQLDAVLVTHEHSDHSSGVAALSRKYQLPVYLSHGTANAGRCDGSHELRCFNCEDAFAIGELEVKAVTVPHDAAEPCQYRLEHGGLSLGILVVEAAPQSGSLITARLAGEQGREVFAIPGSIHNPLAKGCHQLLRQGAKLVETVTDITEEIAPMLAAATGQTHSLADDPELDDDAKKLLPHIGYDPISIDSLIERSQLSADRVCANLLVLELAGMVCSAPGGHYIRAS